MSALRPLFHLSGVSDRYGIRCQQADLAKRGPSLSPFTQALFLITAGVGKRIVAPDRPLFLLRGPVRARHTRRLDRFLPSWQFRQRGRLVLHRLFSFWHSSPDTGRSPLAGSNSVLFFFNPHPLVWVSGRPRRIERHFLSMPSSFSLFGPNTGRVPRPPFSVPTSPALPFYRSRRAPPPFPFSGVPAAGMIVPLYIFLSGSVGFPAMPSVFACETNSLPPPF